MTGALTWARLSYRQQRWELLLVALAVVGVVAAMVYFASTLGALRAASPDCLAGTGGAPVAFPDETGPPAACQAILEDYYATEGMASNLVSLAWAAPFGMGVLLGAPVVAREIDGRTAQLAWSLSRSRVSWLLRRIGFIALFALGLLTVLAVGSEFLAAAMQPDRTLDQDFTWFGRRGLPVVARGFGAIMIGVLVGAFIGRVLPAILASAAAIGLVFVGVSLVHDQWNRSEAVVQRFWDDGGTPVAFGFGALDVDYGLQRLDGEFVSYGEAYTSGLLNETYQDELGQVYASVADFEAGRVFGHDARLSIPGERYPELVLRDSGGAGLVGLLALGLTAVVVRTRAPR